MRTMDRTDRRIVAELQRDARQSNKELAAQVGIAASTCSERVRRLEDDGVLCGYHAEVDQEALGVGLRAMMAIRLSRHAAGEVDRFRGHALDMDEVIGLWHVTGANDFLVHVVVRDAAHLRDLAVSGFTTLPEVSHIETSLVFEHVAKPGLPDLNDVGS
jgi:DNA-binding Lrp family transcriptional regulator